jgi:hypothetical protein
MSEHDRDDRDDHDDMAWLLARERGEPAPEASPSTVAWYERLQSQIKDLPATPAGAIPGPGWKQAVLARIRAAEAAPDAPSDLVPIGSSVEAIARATPEAAMPEAGTPEAASDPMPIAVEVIARGTPEGATPEGASPRRTRTGPRRRVVVVAICTIAAAATILFVVYGSRGGAVVPTLAFEIEPASRAHRSPDLSVGDTLIVRGVVEGTGELRVYDAAGVEQARCTAPAPGCTVDRAGHRTTLQLTLLLRVPGALRAMLFATPLGGPPGGLDADLEAARRAGVAVTQLAPKEVH